MTRKCVTACFLVCAMFCALLTATAWGETDCPSQGNLTVQEGVYNILTSPNYPGKYDNNESCGWQLTAEEGQRVRLCIMDLKVQYGPSCNYDRIILYDGGQPQGDNVIARLCGRASEPEYNSSGNQMYIQFISNYRVKGRGFKVQYTAVGNTTTTAMNTTITTTNTTTTTSNSSSGSQSCPEDGLLTVEQNVEKTLTSPNYPNKYNNDADCGWKLRAEEGKRIHLTVLDLYLEDSSNCYFEWDRLVIFDGGRPWTHNVIATLCDRKQQLEYSSSGNEMYIWFHSDFLFARKGFKLKYTTVGSTIAATTTTPSPVTVAACPSESLLTAEPGVNKTLTSPNYPDYYSNYQHCGWRITAPNSRSIVRLYVMDIDMENSIDCSYDSLSFYDGGNKLLDKYCRRNQQPYVLNYGSDVLIKFKSDGSVTRRGFKLHYTAVPRLNLSTTLAPTTVMPGQFQTAHVYDSPVYQYLQSVNYPSTFYRTERRIWIISCQPGYAVQLRVDDMDLQDSNICTANNTMVVFNSDGYTVLARMCNYQFNGVDLYSTMGSLMHVRLTSAFKTSGKKFSLRYRAVRSSQVLFGYTTRAPTATVPPPDSSNYNYVFIIAGVIGGCAILGVFIFVFCRAYLRSKKPPRPPVGRLSTVNFRSGPTSASANGGVYIVPSNHPLATPVDGFTNLAYSEGPPAYSSLQHNPPVFLPAPGVSPDPTQLGAAPPTYTEAMNLTHPPSRGREESDGACAQPKGEGSPLPTNAVASASPAASFSKPEEPKLDFDFAFDSDI